MAHSSLKSSKVDWRNDAEMFDLIRAELYTPVVGDILDDLGFTHQFLPQPIQPAREEMKLAGRAMPVVMIDVFGKQKKPFGLLTEALDQLESGEIYLASGGEMRCAYWGEILTATAKNAARPARSSTVFIATRRKCWNKNGRFFRAGASRKIPVSGRKLQIFAVRLRLGRSRCNRAIWSSATSMASSSCRKKLKLKLSSERSPRRAARN